MDEFKWVCMPGLIMHCHLCCKFGFLQTHMQFGYRDVAVSTCCQVEAGSNVDILVSI